MNAHRCRLVAALCWLAGLPVLPAGDALADKRNPVAIPLTRSNTGTMLAPATIGAGTRGLFLVDTGATHSVVNRRVLVALRRDGDAVIVRRIRAATADGRSTVATLYRASRLVLSPTCVLKNVEFAHLGDGQRNILGLSALRRLSPFSLDIEHGLMHLTCPD